MKIFKDLTLDAYVYQLDSSKIVPKIEKLTVLALSFYDRPNLKVSHGSTYFYVPIQALHENKYENYYLNKEDANKALEVRCTEIIISLTKAMSKIN